MRFDMMPFFKFSAKIKNKNRALKFINKNLLMLSIDLINLFMLNIIKNQFIYLPKNEKSRNIYYNTSI